MTKEFGLPEYCFCGELLADHDRCSVCGMLIGSKHIEKKPRNCEGKAYCSYCYAMALVSQYLKSATQD